MGTSFAYSTGFSGTFNSGNVIDGSVNGAYYQLEAKKTTISVTAKVSNTDLGATESAYIEARRVTELISAQADYISTGSYTHSKNLSGSFATTKGKHFLILGKANISVPDTITGTISQ